MIVYREIKSLEQDLGVPVRTLYALSNHMGRHYHTVCLPKRDGTVRRLSVPDPILKKVQRAIADIILTQYPVSRFACGYVRGSDVRKNAWYHIGKQKILKLDIDGFFDHIRYSHVKDIVFYREKYAEPIRVLLTMLCYYGDVLPQGAPTSPAITNIIMYRFDETVGHFCEERGISYTRYCDDMTFSGDFDERAVISYVRAELRKLGLFLKDRKTAVVPKTKRQIVTGIVVNEKLNVSRDCKKEIRQEMYYIRKYGLAAHLQKIGQEDAERYLTSLQGRIAYVLHILPHNTEFIGYKQFLIMERSKNKSFNRNR